MVAKPRDSNTALRLLPDIWELCLFLTNLRIESWFCVERNPALGFGDVKGKEISWFRTPAHYFPANRVVNCRMGLARLRM